ncbi:uncharacterized protein LOC143182053 [Calliopsis andreniformis]|uniref:uncharacterized protein LOC143182053 n=1 Tax=Calliopsis andreniformis TaxID=337506 RepID=UPI003FCE51A2
MVKADYYILQLPIYAHMQLLGKHEQNSNKLALSSPNSINSVILSIYLCNNLIVRIGRNKVIIVDYGYCAVHLILDKIVPLMSILSTSGKMQILVVFLVVAGCQLSASFGVHNRGVVVRSFDFYTNSVFTNPWDEGFPGGIGNVSNNTPFQSEVYSSLLELKAKFATEYSDCKIGNLRPNLHSDEFFHQIGDWFGNLKDQIYNKLFSRTTTPTPEPIGLPTEVLDLDRFQLQRRLRNREWRQLDLSTLSFDPNRDWGFRVGNWYFIRKGVRNPIRFDGNSSDESNESPATIPSGSTEADARSTSFSVNGPETAKFSSTSEENMIQTEVQLTTQQTETQAIETSTWTDSPEYSSTQTEKRMEDNETDGGNDASVRKGSVEVLMG